MIDDGQSPVPTSFVELFLDRGRTRPGASRDRIVARHELCEDLAQLLTETARDRLHELHVTEADVLERILSGLEAGDSVDAREARWVVRRLAELLGWPPLERLLDWPPAG